MQYLDATAWIYPPLPRLRGKCPCAAGGGRGVGGEGVSRSPRPPGFPPRPYPSPPADSCRARYESIQAGGEGEKTRCRAEDRYLPLNQRRLPKGRSCLSALLCLFTLGCQQDMAAPPSYRPLQPSGFFADQRSARQPVAGTVARGRLETDDHLHRGKRLWEPKDLAMLAAWIGASGNPWSALGREANVNPYAESFPWPITAMVLSRGQERFDIYCAVCHDRAGTGRGMIVRRGFTAPPSLHTDDAPATSCAASR